MSEMTDETSTTCNPVLKTQNLFVQVYPKGNKISLLFSKRAEQNNAQDIQNRDIF